MVNEQKFMARIRDTNENLVYQTVLLVKLRSILNYSTNILFLTVPKDKKV